MASDILAFDIETKNLSNEIGGWNNTHMFLVSKIMYVCSYTIKYYQ